MRIWICKWDKKKIEREGKYHVYQGPKLVIMGYINWMDFKIPIHSTCNIYLLDFLIYCYL
jgi:hypothetical protein